MTLRLLCVALCSTLLHACTPDLPGPGSDTDWDLDADQYTIQSPNGKLQLEWSLSDDGQPMYQARMGDKVVLQPAGIGFELEGADAMRSGFTITDGSKVSTRETWEMPWGEQREVVNHYNEVTLELREVEGAQRPLHIISRVYNDGVAFRYVFPEQEGVDSLRILEEKTHYKLTADHTAYWIPGDWDIYEHLYNTTKVSEIDALTKRDHPSLAQTSIPVNAVNTPVTMKAADGDYYLSFHEADLTDYSGMTLMLENDLGMVSNLVGGRRKAKVARALPFRTPWRMVLITETAAELLDSRTLLNLNEPNELGDVSYFTPMKYNGIWWEMHLGKASWDMASGKHGATTENTKRYIDFAAANGLGGVLIEGWNTGWERWIGFPDREGVFDFVTPYSDYDLREVVRYANSKGVQIIMHNETSSAVTTYDQQLDTAYKLYEELGIHAIKTGYVGNIIPVGEYHHGQYMVNHYRRVLRKAAEHNIAINAHEPIKGTGIRRTLPNAISREGLRGQEFNAWAAESNPPEHTTIVPFSRMLSGPIDFTPGIFNVTLEPYKDPAKNRVNTTVAKQLALYVVLYSPIQMAADLPEHYENQPALQFIREVGVDWEQSKVLAAEIGDLVAFARQERGTEKWFVGAITDEEAREVTIDFDFLPEGKTYKCILYRDADGTDYLTNPTAVTIEERTVTSKDEYLAKLPRSGGVAMTLLPM